MATVLLAGTVVLSGTIISNADGDNVLSSSASAPSPLTGIDLNETLGLYTLTSASAPFSLTEQTTVMFPTEDVNGNTLTWSYQIVSSSGATHEIQFVAEDGNGNSAVQTFSFQSETVPSIATVVESFSVTQTSNSFVIVPPVWEMPETNSLMLNSQEHFDDWTDTDHQNTAIRFKPEHDGYMSQNSARNGGYHPSEQGADGMGAVAAYIEFPVTANQQYTVETNSWAWDLSTDAGYFLNGDPGSKVRVVDVSNTNNSVLVSMLPPNGGGPNPTSSSWILASGTITPTGNVVRVEVLATAGEQYIESITLTPS